MNIIKVDENNSYETYLIEDVSLDVLMDECMKRVRSISKEYYSKALREDLEQTGESSIDHHAGMGIAYEVKLKND